MRRLTRTTGGRIWLAMLPVLASCSVADMLSSREIIEELDEVVKIKKQENQARLVYVDDALVSAWYMRNALLAPIRTPLGWAFGRRNRVTLENPGEHTRELLSELPNETSGELSMCGAAATRLGWLAELDVNPQTRVIAIDGLSQICRQLDIDPFAGELSTLTTTIDASVESIARATLRSIQPKARRGANQDDVLDSYREALSQLSSAPLTAWDERLRLVEDLGATYAMEKDGPARAWVATSLRQAVGHLTRGILLNVIKGRARGLAELRLCAMEQIRRLGGPRTVPLLLAVMTASPQQKAAGLAVFDPDALVQLRMIHYCGQLSSELANASVRLPGREQWEAPTPSEFLAQTILNERDYYSKVRVPAIVALTWCLGRQHVDADPAWVRKWLEERSGT